MSDKHSLLDALYSGLVNGSVPLGASFAGRMMWHVAQVRQGRRRFWSLELLFDAPVVVSMFFIGIGLAEYFKLGFYGTCGLVAALSYLGPRGVETLAMRWVDKKGGSS